MSVYCVGVVLKIMFVGATSWSLDAVDECEYKRLKRLGLK